jgi:hypothetical protein
MDRGREQGQPIELALVASDRSKVEVKDGPVLQRHELEPVGRDGERDAFGAREPSRAADIGLADPEGKLDRLCDDDIKAFRDAVWSVTAAGKTLWDWRKFVRTPGTPSATFEDE